MISSASDTRRPPPWAVDASPRARPAPRRGSICPVSRGTSCSAWSRPLRPPSRSTWPPGVSMGSRAPRAEARPPNCPRPTPADRLLFILVYLKTYPCPVVPGRRFGLGQRKAQQWSHVRLCVLQATRRGLEEAPTRSVTELAKRRGMTAADASAMVVPVLGTPSPSEPPAAAPALASPLLGLRAPRGASGVPRIRLSRRAMIAASKRATRRKTCCG